MTLLGDMVLLEWIWPYWRNGVTVEVSFNVIYAQAILSVAHSLLLLTEDHNVQVPDPSPAPCLPAYSYVSLNDDNGLKVFHQKRHHGSSVSS